MVEKNETLLGLPIVRVDKLGKDIETIKLGDFSSYLKYRIRKRSFWRRFWRRLTKRQVRSNYSHRSSVHIKL